MEVNCGFGNEETRQRENLAPHTKTGYLVCFRANARKKQINERRAAAKTEAANTNAKNETAPARGKDVRGALQKFHNHDVNANLTVFFSRSSIFTLCFVFFLLLFW